MTEPDDNYPKRKLKIIATKWDVYNSTLLAGKIYRTVEKHKIKVRIDIEHGTIKETIEIIGLAYPIVKDILNYLRNRRRRVEEELKRKLPVDVYIDNEKQEI